MGMEKRLGVDFSGVIGENLNDTFELESPNLESFISISFYIDAPVGGAVIFEQTYDDIHWEFLTLRSVDLDLYMVGTSNGSSFIGSITAARKIRIRTSVAGSAPGVITGRVIKQMSVLEGIEFGYPPHKIGHVQFHVDKSYTGIETDTVLYTPTLGKKFAVTDYLIVASGTTDGIVTIFDETNIEGNRVFNSNIEVVTNKQFSIHHSFRIPFLASTIDNELKITTLAAIEVDVNIHGYEI